VATNSALSGARQRKFELGLPVYLGAAVAMAVLALFAYLQFRSSRPAPDLPLTPEARAYVRSLQLSDVGIKATDSYAGQTVVEIEGKIGNAGDRGLNMVEIYCVFYDTAGQVVLRQRLPIVGGRSGGGKGGLKPGETKPFRLPFDELPPTWNNAMPQLVIAGVKFS
jgi:hypothetical protein